MCVCAQSEADLLNVEASSVKSKVTSSSADGEMSGSASSGDR